MPTTPKIEASRGVAASTWRYTAPDHTHYLLTVARVVGWQLTPGANLHWTPVPTIEVRAAMPGSPDYRTRQRLAIPDATKTRIPWDRVTEVVTNYCTTIETGFAALQSARGPIPEGVPLVITRPHHRIDKLARTYDIYAPLRYTVAPGVRLGSVNTLIHREFFFIYSEST